MPSALAPTSPAFLLTAQHIVLLPVLLPFAAAAGGFLFQRHWRVQALLSLGAMLAAAVASGVLLGRVWDSGHPLVLQLGGWRAPVGITFVADLTGCTFAFLAQVVFVAGLTCALGSRDACVRFPAFLPLFLMLAASLTGAFLTGDVFNLFVFSELMVISATVLTAISDDKAAPEAAYKYFYVATLAGIFLLIACGCLYVSYGTLNMADLAVQIAASPTRPLAGTALACLLVTFLIKGAVVPMHFWQPDFHTAAATPVSAMLSSVVVKLGVYGMLRVTQLLYVADAPMVRWLLLGLGLAGAVFGGLCAFSTHNAKRVLAYSTIGQMGFILFAIGVGTGPALAAAVVFSFNHALVKAAMLMLAGGVASRAPVKSASFAAVGGVGRVMPLAGTLFLIGGMALAGLPPTNGFVSKFAVMSASGRSGMWWPLAVLGLASVVSLMYVGRAYRLIWLEKMDPAQQAKEKGDSLLAPSLLMAACLVLGLHAGPLLVLAADNATWLSSADHYIAGVPVEADPLSRVTSEVRP